MKHNKAAGPDGLPAEFYQHFWHMLKFDLMCLFNKCFHGKIDISRLNYGIISLLPKVSDAARLQLFRPICLSNVIFKLVTKVINNRTILVADKVVSPVQTAFIKGRFILDGVEVLHEVLHEVVKKE